MIVRQNHAMDGDDSKEAQGKRLRLAREHARYRTATEGWEAVKSATKAKISQTTYLHHEVGRRSLRAQAQSYAQAFDVSAAWLVWGDEPPSWVTNDKLSDTSNLAHVKLAPRFLSVRYRVQAGLWMEDDAQAPVEEIEYAVLPHPRFAQWPQWLELVVGDSANLKVPEGHYVHVVDACEMGYAPKTGDWVIVERRRDQGAVRERTVKQVEVQDDGVVLWPRSTNPKWSKPVDLTNGTRRGEEGVEAFIVGYVIGAYDPTF